MRSRIIEELTLLDMRVRSVEGSLRISPGQALPPEVGAVVEINEQAVDLWLRDESGSRSERVRVERAHGMSDELLSLSAVELLRGRLLPVSATEKHQPTPPEGAGSNNPPPVSKAKRDLFEGALGAGATFTSGLPATPHLDIGASFLLPYGLSVGPFAELPVGTTEVEFVGGGLEVWQFAYGAALRFSWSPAPPFRFGASTQLGVRQVAFRHAAAPPFPSSSGTEVLPLVGLGLHGDLLPWSWLGVRAELRGAAWRRSELLAVTSASPPVQVEAESSRSSVSVGSQLAAQLSLVARW